MSGKFELAGHFGVDAGICYIGDPCYILHSKEKLPKSLGKNWSDFSNILQKYNFFKQKGLGVVVSTGWGDGFYPVYVRKNKEGRVIEVKILFDKDMNLDDAS